MSDLQLKIISEFIFPDNVIKNELLRALSYRNIKDFVSDGKKNLTEFDLFLIQFYAKNISEYNKNDRKSIRGAFFHVKFFS